MSEMNEASRIWKPSVELIGNPELAHPSGENYHLSQGGGGGGCGGSGDDNSSQSIRYTKSSLRQDAASDPRHQLNESIRQISQSFNSTARPFTRQTTSLNLPPLHQEPASFRLNQEAVQSRGCDANRNIHAPKQRPRSAMSPKLVHNQYNSPIEMYSMNNIRKTIEAQSELLAPGVKGINFMKSESPINKQSEVYKLIKEEEEERQRLRTSASSSQASGHSNQSHHHQHHQQQQQPLGVQVPTVSINNRQQQQHERVVHYATERNYSSSTDQSANGSNQATSSKVERSLAEAIQQSLPHVRLPLAGDQDGSSVSPSGQPKCSECGQFILGPFAKVQKRCVHPHCFNCSTCGSSLKNSGYFTINEKLYCDIHARQVANVMRLNYNFEPNGQTIDNTRQQYGDTSRQQQNNSLQLRQQVVVEHQAAAENHHQKLQQNHQSDTQINRSSSQDVALNQKQQEQEQRRQLIETSQRCSNCCGHNNQSATISTMFSNRTGAGCACGRRSEIRWIWRPCQAQRKEELLAGDGSVAASATASVAATQAQQHQRHQFEQQQQSMMGKKYESRVMSSSSTTAALSLPTERAPVCCRCRVLIHGPYILAGETIWCKPCSQTNFVCSSCHRSLLNVGFIEDSQMENKYHCEHCFEVYLAPVCAKCHIRIKDQNCLKALDKNWHPNCFVCAHCKCQFGNSSFYLEDDLPYCERDWNLLFTTKCYNCNYPIEAGDKWIEALDRNYHSDCFRCAGCQAKLEGSTFYCKGGKPYCRMHAR